MHKHTKNEDSTSRLSKIRARTGQTDTCDRMHYYSRIRGW